MWMFQDPSSLVLLPLQQCGRPRAGRPEAAGLGSSPRQLQGFLRAASLTSCLRFLCTEIAGPHALRCTHKLVEVLGLMGIRIRPHAHQQQVHMLVTAQGVTQCMMRGTSRCHTERGMAQE